MPNEDGDYQLGGCGDKRIITKAIWMTSVVLIKMCFGKLPKTW
jgi:hypothetical protein